MIIIIIIIIIRGMRIEKEIKKLIKMAMEAIILMLSWHYDTTKIRNNSKTKHGEKKIIRNKNDNNDLIMIIIMT